MSALAAAEADEEECGAQFTPIVQLQEVATSTGEEAEEAKFERWAPTRHVECVLLSQSSGYGATSWQRDEACCAEALLALLHGCVVQLCHREPRLGRGCCQEGMWLPA